MKIILISLVALVLIIPNVFAQSTEDLMLKDLRLTHTILEKNMDQVISLIKNNHTSEALNLLDGIKIKVHHMNVMFNDLVWEMSNKGH